MAAQASIPQSPLRITHPRGRSLQVPKTGQSWPEGRAEIISIPKSASLRRAFAKVRERVFVLTAEGC
jgi:hypothetical protein